MSQTAIGTLVDRASRSLRLVHLPHGHRADQFRAALIAVLEGLGWRTPHDVFQSALAS